MDETKALPVMVFLHGGAFMYGSSGKALYGPDYFVTQSMVLVTLNYRVGAFGTTFQNLLTSLLINSNPFYRFPYAGRPRP